MKILRDINLRLILDTEDYALNYGTSDALEASTYLAEVVEAAVRVHLEEVGGWAKVQQVVWA